MDGTSDRARESAGTGAARPATAPLLMNSVNIADAGEILAPGPSGPDALHAAVSLGGPLHAAGNGAVSGETSGTVQVGEGAVAVEAPSLPVYDWDEILRHDKAGDFWVVFCGGVYDVSEWLYRHPGGAEILIEAWGRNATKTFNSVGHSDEAWLLTNSFKVGLLKKGSRPPEGVGRPTMTVPEGQGIRGPGAHQAGPKLFPLPEPERAPADPRALPEYDWDEILRHDKPGDFWVAMWGGIYDVSEWIYHHPGGAEVFIESYGHDASQAFKKVGHSDEAWKLAQTFKVGRLKKGAKPPARAGPPTLTAG